MLKEGVQKIINSKSKTFLAFCFCFIAGVGIFSRFSWPTSPTSPFQRGIATNTIAFYFFISLFLFLFLVIIFWHKIIFRFCLLCLLFFILRAWRLLITIPDCH